MRALFFAAAVLLFMVTPAGAQEAVKLQCFPGDRDTLRQSMAAVDSGQVKGAYLTGSTLRSFRAEAGLAPNVVAVILFEHEGRRLMAFAIEHGDTIMACVGAATPKGIEVFNRHYGRGV